MTANDFFQMGPGAATVLCFVIFALVVLRMLKLIEKKQERDHQRSIESTRLERIRRVTPPSSEHE